MLWSSTTRLCFATKALIICHLGVPHRQSTPCDWFLSIHNLWARTSQRRALSKRINSPPPNRYIFNRDQSTQNKIQCQTHSPFTSPFWVWTKPEAPIPRIPVQSKLCLDGYYFNSFMVATPITSISSAHSSNVEIVGLQSSSTLRLLNVDWLFEMRWTRPFQIIHVYLEFQINLSHGWII